MALKMITRKQMPIISLYYVVVGMTSLRVTDLLVKHRVHIIINKPRLKDGTIQVQNIPGFSPAQ